MIAADGSVSLPAEGWDAVQELIGRLAALLPGLGGDVVAVLGWSRRPSRDGADAAARRPRRRPGRGARRLAARARAERARARRALGVLADLLTAAGGVSAARSPARAIPTTRTGSRSLAPGSRSRPCGSRPPGSSRGVAAVPDVARPLAAGRPGPRRRRRSPTPSAPRPACRADVARPRRRPRHRGRPGRLIRPLDRRRRADRAAVDGARRRRRRARRASPPVSCSRDSTSRPARPRPDDRRLRRRSAPARWPDAPADRRDRPDRARAWRRRCSPPPAAATGEWFVALGERAACRLAAGRRRRHRRAGRPAGPRARRPGPARQRPRRRRRRRRRATPPALAAEAQAAVSDLVTRRHAARAGLAHRAHHPADRRRAAPAPPAAAAAPATTSPTTTDLALGRHLVAAMVELADRADPAADLRLPATADPPRRAPGSPSTRVVRCRRRPRRCERAITAIVAAGLADAGPGRAT